jgi:hypothetical protein
MPVAWRADQKSTLIAALDWQPPKSGEQETSAKLCRRRLEAKCPLFGHRRE